MTIDLNTCERGEGGSFIVKRTAEYIVEIAPMIYNWRLFVTTPEEYGFGYLHGYCFFGTGGASLLKAVAAAEVWDDPLNTDPVGYDKKAF